MIERDDPKAWALYKDGLTKGLFQLESNLGRAWSKRVAPENLEELAALIAIIRPGTLKAVSEGKSMTQHFVDRKHKREDVVYLDPMFPERQKSARVKKEQQILQMLATDATPPVQLLETALEVATRRVVVKRPRKAPCLTELSPSHCLTGKTVRYDVYVIQPRKKTLTV